MLLMDMSNMQHDMKCGMMIDGCMQPVRENA